MSGFGQFAFGYSAFGAYNLALQIGSGTYYGNIFPNGAYGPTVIVAEGAVVNVTAPVAQSAAE